MSGLFSNLAVRLRKDLVSPPSGQFDSLNGIRALACFLVVAYHVASFSGSLYSGLESEKNSVFYGVVSALWSGLDFFFVLSGFLISRILLNSLDKKNSIEFKSFFVRRSMRVFPAYYLILTLAVFWYTTLDIPYSRFLLVGSEGWEAMRDASWQNYVYIMNYTFSSGDANPMSWAWSLCVEEHFYLALPLFLVLLHKTGSRKFELGFILAVTFLPIFLRAYQYYLDPMLDMQEGFYFRTHNRMDEIMVGVVIGYLYVHHLDSLKGFVERLGALTWVLGVGCILTVWIWGGIHKTGMYPVVFQFLVLALGTGLLMINCLFLSNVATRVLSWKAWFPWARVSYGIYLTHPFVLFALLTWTEVFANPGQLEPGRFLLLYALTMVLSAFVACVMFVVMERPLIDLGVKWSKKF
ncbi:MAG: acyltransferase [Pseudomonadales bacterium]|nr:acyltransferase [Pseudomonadales bacterium]